MKSKYYVVWSVYDHEREKSDTLYRAIMEGPSCETVRAEATMLCGQLLRMLAYQEDWHPVDERAVEIGITPLDIWVASLEDSFDDLVEYKADDDEQD